MAGGCTWVPFTSSQAEAVLPLPSCCTVMLKVRSAVEGAAGVEAAAIASLLLLLLLVLLLVLPSCSSFLVGASAGPGIACTHHVTACKLNDKQRCACLIM